MGKFAQLVERLDQIVDEQRLMRTALEQNNEERDAYHQLYLEILERCRKLERGLLGQKAQRLSSDESQMSLAMMGMLMTNDADMVVDDEEQEVKPHKRRKPTGHQPLPEHLQRIDVIVMPHEIEQEGLKAFEQIGQKVSEVIEHRPSSIVIVRTIKPKYVRKDRKRNAKTKVHVATTHPLPIPRNLANPGMLADSIVKRWDDHLPLNRLERVYGRDELGLARSTICGWHMALANLVKPMVDAMRLDAFEQPFLCTNTTGVLVQAKHKCRHGHFWVMVAPERHVLFEFTIKHNNSAVDSVLADYEDYLVADAHAVYDHLYRDGPMTEVNCWAHARPAHEDALMVLYFAGGRITSSYARKTAWLFDSLSYIRNKKPWY